MKSSKKLSVMIGMIVFFLIYVLEGVMKVSKIKKGLQSGFLVCIFLSMLALNSAPVWAGACAELGVDCTFTPRRPPSGGRGGGDYDGGRRGRDYEDDGLYNKGHQLFNKGDYDGAIEYYKKALRINPNHEYARYSIAEALNRKGNQLLNKGDYDGAIEYYKEALRINPNHEYARGSIATAKGDQLFNKGDYDGAIEYYKEALKVDPGATYVKNYIAEALNRKAHQLSDKEDYDGAIEYYKEALRIDPNNAYAKSNIAAALNNKGVQLFKKEDHDGAIEYYKEALRIDPNNAYAKSNIAAALNNKGVQLFKKEDLAGAVKYYQNASEMNPDDETIKGNLARAQKRIEAAKAANEIGAKLYKGGDFKRAEKYFKEALEMYPGNGAIMKNLARAEKEEAKRIEASHALTNKGNEVFNKGDLAGAVKYYQNASEMNPDDETIKGNLAMAQKEMRKKEERIEAAKDIQKGVDKLIEDIGSSPKDPSSPPNTRKVSLGFMDSNVALGQLKTAAEEKGTETGKCFDKECTPKPVALPKENRISPREVPPEVVKDPKFIELTRQMEGLKNKEKELEQEIEKKEAEFKKIKEQKASGKGNNPELDMHEYELKNQLLKNDYERKLNRKEQEKIKKQEEELVVIHMLD